MKKKIFALMLGIIGVITGISDTYALENDSNLTTQYIDNTYAYHYKGGVLRSYGKLPFRYQNGVLAYCIEPDRVINHTVYNSTDNWSITGYSEDIKKQMELISYYGYEYPGHNTVRYYMATQELIWLYTDDYVKWMDRYSTDGSLGNQINIDAEKNEILRLINNHKRVPSFANLNYQIEFDKELSLNDNNGVFSNFNVTTDINYNRNGNNLKVKINKFGTSVIHYTRKVSNNKTTIIYYHNSDSQMMASFGLNDTIKADTYFTISNVKVKINKKDIQTKEMIKEKNVTFKIKNLDNNTEKELKTNENGYIDTYFNKGKYEIEEINAPNGYVINKDKITVNIDDNIKTTDGYYIIDVFNDKPKGKIIINKQDEDKNNLNGVEIGLFDKDHNKLYSLVTNGNDYFDNLSLGTYYIKELDTLNGYILDDKEYKVDLKFIDDETYTVEKSIELLNKKIRCDIVYISSEKLKDIEINVYDENNKIIFSGKTDDNGMLTISNLPYGKYYIKQIKVPRGYILNEDEYIFYVNDSTCNSKIDVSNEKTVMPITTTSINKSICFSLILGIIGLINYVKKSN